MIFDEVKCLGSPRTSQMPRSGSFQFLIAASTNRVRIVHNRSSTRSRDPLWTHTESRMAPQTSCCFWSNAPLPMRTGRECWYPSRWSSSPLLQLALPADPVHDLHVVADPGDVGDEREEVVGLPVEPEPGHRPEGERRVADPGVAVVPVPFSTRRFRQRGRGGGNQRAGRCVRERLEGQRAALEVDPPRVVGEASRAPASAASGGRSTPAACTPPRGYAAARAATRTARRSASGPPSSSCAPSPGSPRTRGSCRS